MRDEVHVAVRIANGQDDVVERVLSLKRVESIGMLCESQVIGKFGRGAKDESRIHVGPIPREQTPNQVTAVLVGCEDGSPSRPLLNNLSALGRSSKGRGFTQIRLPTGRFGDDNKKGRQRNEPQPGGALGRTPSGGARA